MSTRNQVIQLCALMTAKGQQFQHDGHIGVLEQDQNENCGVDDTTPDDIAIYWDFCTDELSNDQTDKLIEWLFDSDTGLNLLMEVMTSWGYKMIGDHDGSGGGLYYGALVYRKV